MENNNNSSKAAERTLFGEFPPVSREEWDKLISEDLNGGDYRKKLRWETGEDIEVLPFYRREDLQELEHTGPVPAGRKEKNEWEIRQPVYGHELPDAKQTIQSAVEWGADGVQLKQRIHKTDGMLGGDLEGTAIQSQEDFDALFEDLPLEHTGLHFDTSMASPAVMAMLHNLADQRGLNRENLSATFLYDPYLYTITSGQWPKPEQDFLEEARQMAEFAGLHLPKVRCLGVDARGYHNAGATIVQEVAFALATGSEYLANLTGRELPAGQIASRIHFSFAVGSNYFLEIAKFRAFRVLWRKVLDAYSREKNQTVPAYVHGETSEWNKTLYDPYTNMLRTTTEGMSAAIAGCDAVTIHPFNLTFRQPGEFARRIARNAQIIFKEEARLDQVYDPGAGSYYIETLTDKIAGQSWKLFREIEKQGGMMKAITNRTVATMIGRSVENKNRTVAERGRVFVGTNQYPNAGERMADQIDSEFRVSSLLESDHEFELDKKRTVDSLAEGLKKGVLLGDIVPDLFDLGKQLFDPIQPYRGADAFEELRLATERQDSTPTVFLLPMGDRKRRKARSTFAANFLGCAGYEIVDNIGFENIDGAIGELKGAAPDIVVLCSSDSEYRELVEPLCRRIRELDVGPLIVLAGYPEDELERYRRAGVELFIHSGSNVLDTLKEIHDKLGILNN